MFKNESRLASCERHIADLRRRIDQLTATPNAGSGFLPATEVLASMQQMLDGWLQYRDRLVHEEAVSSDGYPSGGTPPVQQSSGGRTPRH